jgi:cytochrome P450
MITDSILAIVAGSDTTAIVMCNILYFLLSTPSVFKRLQVEIDMVFPRGEGDALDGTRLADCAVLNAVM